MTIEVNGTPTEVADGITISGLLDALDVPAGGRGVAVAVEAEVVPRATWEDRVLEEGARVEVVAAVQGG